MREATPNHIEEATPNTDEELSAVEIVEEATPNHIEGDEDL